MKKALLVSIVSIHAAFQSFGQERRSTTSNNAAADRPGIHKLEELTWPQIDALHRERTLFILSIGMLEEHGPHLPVGADTLGVLYEATRVAKRLNRALPEWNVVMMPPIHYGQGGANHAGGILVHPGTYAIRQSTVRSIVADVGGQVAQNGFRWIFVLNGHGAPLHTAAINEACDFVSETFKVTMLHVTALFKADAAIQAQGTKITGRYFSQVEIASFGMDVHAGVGETSAILAIRPDLVDAGYKRLPSRAARNFSELLKIASQPGWPGYLSSPAKARADYGRAFEGWWVEGCTDLISRAVRGENMFRLPRLPEANFGSSELAEVFRRALESERAFDEKLARWLEERRRR